MPTSIRRALVVGVIGALAGCGSNRGHTPPVSHGVAPGEADGRLRGLEFAELQPKPLNDAERPTPPPPEVRFAVDSAVAIESLGAAGSPEPQRPVLIVTGRLQNPAATERTVRLFPVGRFGRGPARDTPFEAALLGSPAVSDTSPALTPAPPRSVEITIPPRSEIVFRTAIDTLHLRYAGRPEVEIGWTFHFGQPERNPTGTLRVQLPARP